MHCRSRHELFSWLLQSWQWIWEAGTLSGSTAKGSRRLALLKSLRNQLAALLQNLNQHAAESCVELLW